MQGDWVRQHGKDIHDDLLRCIEFVKVNRIEAGLGIDAASKEKCIGVAEIRGSAGIYQYRSYYSAADDPNICEY